MKSTITSILITIALIGGAVFLAKGGDKPNASYAPVSNVYMADGKQIVEIDAKGGYSPRITSAKANVPTVFRVKTNGTFDCSSALSIPSIGYTGNLAATGVTDIEVPAQQAGAELQGICAMGMYNFSVQFN